MRFRKVAATAAFVALIATISAPAGAAEGTRGTGDASLTGVSIDVGELASVDLVELSSLATRDADRAGVAQDLARGSLSLGSVALSDFAEVSIPPDPLTVQRSSENSGSDSQSHGAVSINVPGTIDFPDDADTADSVIDAADVAADRGSVIDLVNGLAGSSAPSIADGGVLSGSVAPLDLLAVFDDVRAAFTGDSRIADASALGGLVSLDGFGIAEQGSWSELDEAGAVIRGASLDSLTVLDLEAFFHLLGLSFDDLSLATLTALADGLGLDLTGTFGDLDLDAFDTWDALRDELTDTRDELQALIDTGDTCDQLTDPISDLLGDAGVLCDELEEALADVNGLIDDLLDAVEGVLSGAALLTVEDVVGEVQAVAAVDETGTALTSAIATGRVGAIKVGDVQIGSIEADLSKDSASVLEAKAQDLAGGVHTQLDEVLGILGDAYTGIVEVLPIAVLEQRTGIDGQYATADALLSLLQVRVNVPDSLPEPDDLTETLDGGDEDSTEDDDGDDGGLLDDADDLLDISNVRPVTAVHGQVAPLGQTVAVDVGVFSASAEHTREVEITGGGDNRTFDSRTGFSDGPIPRTGGETGLVLLLAAVLTSAGWLGRRVLAGAVPNA